MTPEVRILMLEDSPLDAELIERELRRSGLAFESERVETVSDFTWALQVFKPDLVLSDNALPSFDALSALALTRKVRPETAFVVVSGTVGEERAVEMMKSGVTDYVLKHHLDRLGPVVHRAIAETEHRREAREGAEAARLANERFRSAFESAPAGLAVLDGTGVMVHVNAAITTLLGRSEQQLLGAELVAFADPADQQLLEGLLSGRRADPNRPAEVRFEHPSGRVVWVLIGVSVLEQAEGHPVHVIAQLVDVTAAKDAEAKLLHQALYDQLTGLPNRLLIEDRLRHALDRCARRGSGVTVLFIDLDDFKVVNDSLGHGVGDMVLDAVAKRLGSVVRDGDTAGRFGGDEFVVVCEDQADPEEALQLATRIAAALAEPCVVGGRRLTVAASIGIAVCRDPETLAEDLLRDADGAMYRAKELGRGRALLFDEAMRVRAVTRLTVEADLRQSLDQGDFVVHYQPQVDLRSHRLVGFEALVRWRHPERGMVPPDDFISVAEETGLVLPLGAWVLEAACAQAARWLREVPDLVMSVNVSARQLAEDGFVDVVHDVLARTGLPPTALGIEVTESVLVVASSATSDAIDTLRGLGVKLSIDDFGTGYASLSYLAQFRPDVIKIDKSFVQGLDEPMNAAIAAAVIGLAHSIGMKVVAEGVESYEHREVLDGLGCDIGQGHLFAKALTEERAGQLVAGEASGGSA